MKLKSCLGYKVARWIPLLPAWLPPKHFEEGVKTERRNKHYETKITDNKQNN